MSLLLDNGADLNNTLKGCGSPPLFFACASGNTAFASLLLDRGADANHGKTNGETPLFPACFGGHTECVELLLSRGANPNTQHGQ